MRTFIIAVIASPSETVARQSRAELKRPSRRPPAAHGIASHGLQLAMTDGGYVR